MDTFGDFDFQETIFYDIKLTKSKTVKSNWCYNVSYSCYVSAE